MLDHLSAITFLLSESIGLSASRNPRIRLESEGRSPATASAHPASPQES